MYQTVPKQFGGTKQNQVEYPNGSHLATSGKRIERRTERERQNQLAIELVALANCIPLDY